MSKKIYVVSDGLYEDYEIKGIFSTREKSEELQKHFPSPNDIEEIELDPEIPYPSDQLAYRVCFVNRSNPTVSRANPDSVTDRVYQYNLGNKSAENIETTEVFAANEKEAIAKAKARIEEVIS